MCVAIWFLLISFTASQEGITDYPLISRAKSTRSFRDLLIGFFKSLLIVLHETEVLYKESDLMENITRWIGSMSSSTLRPFRHTATTVALAMEGALVEIAKKLDDRITKMTQQLEAEKSRKGKNKDRLAAIQKTLDGANENRTTCEEMIMEYFDTVFIHRYRDIDPKIRIECVEALGSWVMHLSRFFMRPEFLRYLGWMLSDVVPQTRQEVLKQLARVLKRDAEKLGHFIDRFRPRLMEIVVKDSDVGVRVAAIAVVQILKDTGMLDPAEIDSVGRLIFDTELRIRRAVIDFFAGCVNDSIETKIESIGGQDVVDEIFGDDDEEDYLLPRQDWIAIKCLAELLAAYDAQLEEESQTEPPRGLDIAVEMVQAVAPETRISLASQVLYEKIDQVKNWELLSGYLLYDHTASSKGRSAKKSTSNEAALRDAVAPENNEEPILLEVMASAVRASLAPGTEVDKTRKRTRPDGDGAEDSAVTLATIIPRLLKKFGAEASTAVIVLRLEHCLDLDVFQQLRQDSTTYGRLLDEICTQFDRHVDRGVLTEATTALLHARKYDELEELADAKISELWENVLNALRHFDRICELGVRNNLDVAAIAELGHILVKMSKLASISNCIEVLEADGTVEGSDAPAIEILVRVVHRGKLDQVDEALDDLEDEAVSFAIKCCQFYFMWQARTLIGTVQAGNTISGREVESLNQLRKTYDTNLVQTLSSRGTNDELRLFSTGGLCDLHVVFATLKQVVDQHQQANPGSDKNYAILKPLLEPITPGLLPELIEVYDAAERAYARCLKRTLNEPAVDEDPLDDDDDQFSDDEGENDGELTEIEKKGKELKAERALCELAGKLVLAILAKQVDQVGPNAGKLKKRMMRNHAKLGPNLKETLAYLDEKRVAERLREGAPGSKKKKAAAASAASKGKGKQPAKGPGKHAISEEIVVVGDDDSDDEAGHRQPEEIEDDEEEVEEGTAEDLRRRELLDEDQLDPIEDDSDGGGGQMDEDESILGD